MPLKRMLGIDDMRYESCDSDTSQIFTYSSVQEIPIVKEYDVVASNQAFEHLAFNEALPIAIKLAAHVKPGGVLEIGVPNPSHPVRQQSHPTHITPWNYLNLCALMMLGGLEPIICARSNKRPGPRWWEKPVVSVVCNVFRMDWCDSIYVVGRKA